MARTSDKRSMNPSVASVRHRSFGSRGWIVLLAMKEICLASGQNGSIEQVISGLEELRFSWSGWRDRS